MTITVAQLATKVSVEGADKAKSDLQGVSTSTSQAGGFLKNALGGALSFAAGAAGDALGFLKDQLVDSVKIAMQHQQVMQQTAQVLLSTHGAAGMTASAVSNLATSFSQVTPFSEDMVQSTENMLLTFTGIGKQVFPQATQATLDLAQAMHSGPQQAAIMLGKALNDPTTGLTALTRVGVTFSAQEKEQIKTMMAHNDIIGAQKVMLKELGTEFGGSAEAAGKTFGGQLQILQNRLEDVKDKIGTAILPILSNLTGFVSNNVMPVLDKFGDWFGKNAMPVLGQIGQQLGIVGGNFLQLGRTIGSNLMPLLKPFGDAFSSIGGAFDGIQSKGAPFLGIFAAINDTFQTITPQIQGFLKSLQPVADAVGGMLKSLFAGMSSGGKGKSPLDDIGSALKQVAPLIGMVVPGFGVLGTLFQVLSENSKQLGQWFQTSVIPAFKQAEPGFMQLVKAGQGLLPVIQEVASVIHNTLHQAMSALIPIFEKAIPIIIQIAGILSNGLGRAIQFLTPYIMQAVKAIGQFASDIITRVEPIVVNFLNNLQTGINVFMKIWNTVWPYLAPILKGVFDEIRGVIEVAWSLISGIFKIALDLLSGNWSQAWTDLKDMLSGVLDGIKTMISGWLEVVEGWLSAAWAAIQTVASDAWNAVWGAISGAWTNITNTVSNGISGIRNFFQNLKTEALQWGEDMINSFVSGIKNTIGNIGSAVGNVGTTIKNLLHFSKPDEGPLADSDTWMPDMMQMFADHITQNTSKVKTAMQGVASVMSQSVNPASSSALSSSFGGSNYQFPSMTAIQNASQPQIVVQPAPVYLDGRLMTRGLLPYFANAIRGGVGTHGV